MKSAELCIDRPVTPNRQAGLVREYAKKLLLAHLGNLRHGELILNEEDEQYIFGQQDETFPKTVTVTVTDADFYTRVLMYGEIGAGEAYMNGYWECNDLTSMVELFLCNSQYMENIEEEMARQTIAFSATLLAPKYPERQPPQYRGAL